MANKLNITPKPWDWRLRRGSEILVISIHPTGALIQICEMIGTRGPEEKMANARLIVEAPDMFEALKDALPLLESGCCADDPATHAAYHKIYNILERLGGVE